MKLTNFYDLISDILEEKDINILDLEKNGILSKNKLYSYKTFMPSLNNIIAIANYLEVSIDYILANTSENKFKRYKETQNNFFNTISTILKTSKISQSKLCKDLGLSRANFSYWKNGTIPKFSTIIEISKYLNCNIDDILERE